MALAEMFKEKIHLPVSTLERNAGWWREKNKEMGFHHVYSFVLYISLYIVIITVLETTKYYFK